MDYKKISDLLAIHREKPNSLTKDELNLIITYYRELLANRIKW